ncbi:MAG: hypothetical protein WBX25_16615 [Rhodomicrobium sp.]
MAPLKRILKASGNSFFAWHGLGQGEGSGVCGPQMTIDPEDEHRSKDRKLDQHAKAQACEMRRNAAVAQRVPGRFRFLHGEMETPREDTCLETVKAVRIDPSAALKPKGVREIALAQRIASLLPLRPIPLFQAAPLGLLGSVGEEPIADFGEQAESVALRGSRPGEEARSAPSIPDQDASL